MSQAQFASKLFPCFRYNTPGARTWLVGGLALALLWSMSADSVSLAETVTPALSGPTVVMQEPQEEDEPSDDATPAVDPVALKWQFQAGQTYRFDLRQVIRSSEVVAENTKEARKKATELRVIIDLTVAQVQDGIATMELRYKQFDVAVESGGRATASTNPDVPSAGSRPTSDLAKGMLQSLSPLIDKPVQLKVDTQGSIQSVAIAPEVIEQILEAPNTLALRGNLSKEGIEDLFKESLITFPEDPASRWKKQSTVNVAGVDLTRTTVYQLAAIDDASASIQFETNVTFPTKFLAAPKTPEELDDPTLKDKPAPFNFDPIAAKWPRIARQEAKGTIQFDRQQGHVTSANSNRILVTQKAQSNFLIEITVDTQTELEVTRLETR